MPRPSLISEKRRELLPVVAQAFAELGYRRTTTAELARRCGVRENILYRLWPDKKAMFIASISYVYESSIGIWRDLLEKPRSNGRTSARRLLEYESRHHGEFGLYRIVFAGLSETDDPEIRGALADMYKRYQRFVTRHIAAHRGHDKSRAPDAALAAWAVVGLGTVANITRELGLVSPARRRRLFATVGRLLLGGASGAEDDSRGRIVSRH
jgi:AcrR family transcriptional regulator